MIDVQNITHAFDDTKVFENFSLSIQEGQVLSLLGQNGCGKSTLLQMLLKRLIPQSGTIEFAFDLVGKVGMVFQDYRLHLLPYRTVRENIVFPLKLRGVSPLEQQARLESLLDLVSLSADLNAFPAALSGGQAQTASLLRALIMEPRVLILDEPSSALDYLATLQLQANLLRVISELKLTTILVSHSIDEAILLADELMILEARPMRLFARLPITLGDNRSLELLSSPQCAEIKREVIRAMHSLSLGSNQDVPSQ
jgi:NitT/TauT family transport system ATP-binding protein